MSVLERLPRPSTKRIAMRVTPDALRQVRSGHPWLFDRSIVSASHDGSPGDLAVVFDDDRRFAAIGLFDPGAIIRVRVLHAGKPVTIDERFWSDRVERAIARRDPILLAGKTTGYRVIHGENDGMPGLVLDRYGTTFVAKLYSAAWVPHLAELVPVVCEQLPVERMIVRFSRDVRSNETALHGLAEADSLVGTAPSAPVRFTENGLSFEADVVRGQKTGHFLDQRDNRHRLSAYTKGLSVLDVFSCTGGFSVAAAAGGAAAVHSVDLSAGALATAQRNMAHNASIAAVRNCAHTTEVGDAFDVMRRLAGRGRRFDIVVVDPPSFARRQRDVSRALHAYGTLTDLALALLDRDGVLVQSSCSSRVAPSAFFDAIHASAARSGHRLTEMLRTSHAADHPIGFAEGEYLKTLFARIAR